MLRMVKIGDYIEDKDSLIKKLKQSSLAVHGFPLVIQLLEFRAIPRLLEFLPHGDDRSTFLDQSHMVLRRCRSYHTSNILCVEHDLSLQVIFPLQLDSAFCSTEQSDPKVQRLETLISSGYRFTKTFSFSGDASLPSLWSSSKRKLQCCNSTSSGSEVHSPRLSRKFYKNSKVFNSVEDVDGMVTSKIKDFKQALMADLGELLCHTNKGNSSHESTAFSTSLHASGCTCPPFRVTHSECVGFHGHFDATKSFYVPKYSSQSAANVQESGCRTRASNLLLRRRSVRDKTVTKEMPAKVSLLHEAMSNSHKCNKFASNSKAHTSLEEEDITSRNCSYSFESSTTQGGHIFFYITRQSNTKSSASMEKLDIDVALDIVERVGFDSFTDIAGMLLTSKFYRSLAYHPTILQSISLQFLFSNADLINLHSPYRPVFTRCLHACNPTACYLQSLKLAGQDGHAEIALQLLLTITNGPPHVAFATALLQLVLGFYEEAIHNIDTFVESVGSFETADAIGSEVFRQMMQIGT
ncbi:hypothetical protein ARALYDRAFT_891232 [Arabidopsis lyrata subsp. lyrata]|uniref:Uncharacterized protein n=1 Tax=Arabidopsis lyrata subsp. lyrata TaxID=81972 RepID=D7KLY1_ARALL|nr:hypothetical protein ARALYDRAFT_891232 [Arabidopsis lyrata subsp. lyrata]